MNILLIAQSNWYIVSTIYMYIVSIRWLSFSSLDSIDQALCHETYKYKIFFYYSNQYFHAHDKWMHSEQQDINLNN